MLKRIVITGAAINEDSERYAGTDEHKREEDHWLNQKMRVKMRRMAGQVTVEPRPSRREDEAEKNRAKREHDQRQRHHRRTFVRVLRSRAPAAEENENYLPCHVKRGQNHSEQHEVMRRVRG